MWELSGLTSEQKIGQLLMLGFSGTRPSSYIKRLISEYGLGGVVLFGCNIDQPLQVARLCGELQELALDSPSAIPLFIAIDQEGGRVVRLKDGFTPLPTMASLGATGSVQLAYSLGELIGRELGWLGINMDLAPVLDVNSQLKNPVIGDRAFGDDPALVARLGGAIRNGLNQAGVLAVGKHFPGHGDTMLDSHLGLPLVIQPRQGLDQRELVPFKAAIADDFEALMPAHVLYTALDGEYPATLSNKILTKLLRQELGFKGLVLSDDMLMRAMDQDRLPHLAVRAVQAGIDMLLFGREDAPIAQVIEALLQAVTQETISQARLDQAIGTTIQLKNKWLNPPPKPDYEQLKDLGCQAHRQVIKTINQRAKMTVA